MLFFTLDWWLGQQVGESRDSVPAYQLHLQGIEGSLPPALLALERGGPLHDSKLRAFQLNLQRRSLDVDLDAYGPRGEAMALRLSYLGVVSLHGYADPESGLPGPHGFGDLGYTEAHFIDGLPEHWLLFSSGIELRVRFEAFEERTNPRAPLEPS